MEMDNHAGPLQNFEGASDEGYRYRLQPVADAEAVKGLLSVSSQNPENVPSRAGSDGTVTLFRSPKLVTSI
jgi:hypothetical protein